MKWIYFYTPDYQFWHKHLQNSLSKSFKTEPIEISSINAASKNGKHHFSGITLKIDLLIEKIKENMGERIVFSDCTLWLNQDNRESLFAYINSIPTKWDLALPDNRIDRTANIGLLLVDCNNRTLQFFLQVKNKMNTHNWDQEAVNICLPGSWILRITKLRAFHLILPTYKKIRKLLSSNQISWTMLDREKIVCGLELPEKLKQSYLVYKQFVIPSTPNDNWNQRISKLHENGLIGDSIKSQNLRN